jgi:pSer/pThr/pTyr-binding forkhead associated (FHA) protein
MAMRMRYTHRGREHTIGLESRSIIIGRSAPDQPGRVRVDLAPDLMVSQRHAELTVDDGGLWWIEHLGSTNGTRMDGQWIAAHRKIRLDPGTTFAISDVVFEVDE